MLSLFGFSKKRRSAKRSKKVAKKPPAKLLKICKKLKIKATVKRGGKRVYKSKSALKKMCLKKLRALKKRMLKQKKMMLKKKKTQRRKGSKRVKRVSSRMGGSEFGRRSRFGQCSGSYMGGGMTGMGGGMSFGNSISFGGQRFGGSDMEFGKRRRVARRSAPKRMSKAAAMKAFKKFYKRNCSVRARGSRFGNGGNPSLINSMGYEYCKSGYGGVLGATSTGLFPSPCSSTADAMAQQNEMNAELPDYSLVPNPGAGFGKRRRYRKKATKRKVPKTKKGLKKALTKCRKSLKRKVSRRKVSRRKVSRRRS
jgi:hypothetical protein